MYNTPLMGSRATPQVSASLNACRGWYHRMVLLIPPPNVSALLMDFR